MLFEFAEVVFI